MKNKIYTLCSALTENPSRHCASLAIVENIVKIGTVPMVGRPDENSRNGTLTFVKSEGNVFAITCWHVIEKLRGLNIESAYKHTLSTMTPSPYSVTDRFIRPTVIEYSNLDIGIRQVSASFLKAIKKEPIDLDNQSVPDNIEFGLAVGFPEKLKYKGDLDLRKGTQRIILPTVSILAEIDRMPNSRFSLFSEFDQPQGYETYSGMSGGPIFWSNENEYGIFGIIYQSDQSKLLEKGKSIIISGELATPETIRHWISQISIIQDDK